MSQPQKKLVIAEAMQTRNDMDSGKKSKLKKLLIELHKKREWSEDPIFRETLMEDSVTQEDIDDEINEKKHKHGYAWQHKLEKMLTYTPFQIFCLILAVIDVAIVIAVILLQLNIYKGKFLNALHVYTDLTDFINEKFKFPHPENRLEKIKAAAVNYTCTSSSKDDHHDPDPNPTPDPHHRRSVIFEFHREKRSSGGGGGGIIPDSDDVSYMYATVHSLHITSVSILAFFTLLVFVKIAAEGLNFFKKAMEILDALVVIVSFILDVLILAEVINPEQADAVIVILLLWQIVRIFNGIMMMEIQRLEMRVKLLKRGKKKLKEKIDANVEERISKDKEIESLQNLSIRKGATDDEVALCRPAKVLPKLNAHSGLGAIASISLGFSMQAPVELDPKALKGKMKIPKKSDDFGNFMKDTLFFPDQDVTGGDGENNGNNGQNTGDNEPGVTSGSKDVDADGYHQNRVDDPDENKHAKIKRMESVDSTDETPSTSPADGHVTLDLDAQPSTEALSTEKVSDEEYARLSNTGLDKLLFGTGKSEVDREHEYTNQAFSSV